MTERQPSKIESRVMANDEDFKLYPTDFDPYRHPPSLEAALVHQRATNFAKFNPNSPTKCPCCQRVADTTPLSMLCSVREIAILSPTYANLFFFIIFGGMILVLVFLLNSINLLVNYPSIRHCFLTTCDVNIEAFRARLDDDTTLRVLAVVTQVLLIVAKQFFYRVIKRLDTASVTRNTQASDFTLIVNAPGYRSEQQIKDEIEATLRRRGVEVEVLKVNKVYNIEKYYECARNVMIAQKNLKRLRVLCRESDPAHRKFSAQYSRNMKQLEKQTEEFKTLEGKRRHFAMKAFVTFATQRQRVQAEYVLSRFYGLHLFKADGYSGVKAQDPMSYQWENFGQDWVRKNLFRLFTALATLVLLFVFFVIILVMKNLQSRVDAENSTFGYLMVGFAIALMIAAFNIVLILTIKYMTVKERRTLYSSAALSAAFKIFVSLFVNTGLVVLIASYINLKGGWMDTIWATNGTVPNMTLVMLVNMIINPLLFVLDVPWIVKIVRRRKMMRLFRDPAAVNQYVQCEVNEVFENAEFQVSEGYYFFFLTLAIALFYSWFTPYGLLFGLVEFTITYWVHKWRLLRRSIVSYEFNFYFSVQMGTMFDLCILVFAVGAVAFHGIFQQTKVWFVVLMVVFGGFDVITNIIASTLRLCLKSEKQYADVHYVNHWLFFLSDYDRRNPVTAFSAYREWVQALKDVDPNVAEPVAAPVPEDPRQTMLQFVQAENRFGHGEQNLYFNDAVAVSEKISEGVEPASSVNVFTASKEANEKLRVFKNKQNIDKLDAQPSAFSIKQFPAIMMPQVFNLKRDSAEQNGYELSDFIDAGRDSQAREEEARSTRVLAQAAEDMLDTAEATDRKPRLPVQTEVDPNSPGTPGTKSHRFDFSSFKVPNLPSMIRKLSDEEKQQPTESNFKKHRADSPQQIEIVADDREATKPEDFSFAHKRQDTTHEIEQLEDAAVIGGKGSEAGANQESTRETGSDGPGHPQPRSYQHVRVPTLDRRVQSSVQHITSTLTAKVLEPTKLKPFSEVKYSELDDKGTPEDSLPKDNYSKLEEPAPQAPRPQPLEPPLHADDEKWEDHRDTPNVFSQSLDPEPLDQTHAEIHNPTTHSSETPPPPPNSSQSDPTQKDSEEVLLPIMARTMLKHKFTNEYSEEKK